MAKVVINPDENRERNREHTRKSVLSPKPSGAGERGWMSNWTGYFKHFEARREAAVRCPDLLQRSETTVGCVV